MAQEPMRTCGPGKTVIMKKLPFYTHSGFFHADEVTGFAICELADQCSEVVRLTSLDDIPEDGVIADIGREYDPERLKFDHHQGMIRRETGCPYASAGLLWKHYGVAAVMNLLPVLAGQKSRVDAIVQRVDETIIQGIDAHDADNAYVLSATCSAGEVRPVTISHIIAGMNAEDVAIHEKQASLFKLAAGLVQNILRSHIRSAAKFMEACDMFDAVAKVQGQIITLSEGLPWREIVHERYPDVLYIISPSNHPGNPWSMTAVTVKPESRECKRPIERPDWFTGFIHQGKWIAGGSSIEELKKLAAYNGCQ